MSDVAPITVVIPAYNAEPFLAAAIHSVQTQRLPASEIIVVDDGSADRTAAVAEQLGAQVLRQKKSGVSAARNAGIRCATQPWIAFLDADDLWEPDKLQYQWAAIQRFPGAGLVSCDLCVVKNDEVVVRSCLDPDACPELCPATQSCCLPRPPAAFLVRQMNYFPSAVVVRREALLAVGLFDESLHYNEDFDCFLQIIARWPLVMVARPLVRHRLHEGNVSRNTVQMALSYVQVAGRIRAHPNRYPPGVAQLYHEEALTMLAHTGRTLLVQGRMGEARELLTRSLTLSFQFRALLYWGLTWMHPAILKQVLKK